MIIRWLAVGALVLMSLTPAKAADDEQGKACLLACQEKLKKDGTWTTAPRGICRRQCDYWVGAPPEVKR